MIRALDGLPLFAERDGLDEVAIRFGEGFRGSGAGVDAEPVVFGAAVVLGILLLSWAAIQFAPAPVRRLVFSHPRRLFLGLCRAHRLRWSERWLLWQLARHDRMDNPAQIFLEPFRFETDRLPPRFQWQTAQIQSLHSRLFADLETPGSSAASEERGGAGPVADPSLESR